MITLYFLNGETVLYKKMIQVNLDPFVNLLKSGPEDIFDNYKLLNFEETQFRVDTISNNTFLKVSSGETPHQILKSPILLERAEIV